MIEWQTYQNEFEVLAKIFQISSPYERAFSISGSFGDVYIQLSCIVESVSGKLPDEQIICFVHRKYELLINLAKSTSTTFYLVDDGIDISRILAKHRIFSLKKGYPTLLLPTLYPLITEIMSDGLIDYISLMRHICRSPQQGDLHRLEPGVDSYSYATLKGLNCIPGRTVIVSPETNTHHSLPDDLWIILIKVLLYRNFSVLLNISSNNHNKIREHFLHTESVAVWQLPSHLPVRITEAAGFFIGMNCGLTGIQSIWCKNTFGIVINNLTIKSNGKPVDKGGNVWKKENLSFFKLMPKLNFYGLSEFFIESSDDFRLLVNELLAW